MDIISPASSLSARLYSFLLTLRPLQPGSLMAFNGELVHAAWLEWMRTADPEIASWLHEGGKRRLFTCSSLLFPYPQMRMRDAERRNVHLPLSPEQTYQVRITLLLGELFPLFHHALTMFNTNIDKTASTSKTLFIQLGKQQFALEGVVVNASDDPSCWTDWTSLADLVTQTRAIRMGRAFPLTLAFDSLTTFNRGSAKGTSYDSYFARLPLPHLVFSSLAKRWQELAPSQLAGVVQREQIDRYVQEEGIIIDEYDLQPHTVKFTTHWQPGFVGTCTYLLRRPDWETSSTEETPLTIRQQVALLARFAFYTGVGYKTAMGMGRVRASVEKKDEAGG
jgi:CRISPR-associated endoribonuclease Cas6